MATEKILKARIVHKHDNEANWLKASTFVPKEGEMIIYGADANNFSPRLKVGDGTTNVNNLPFVAEPISTDMIDAICIGDE